MKGKFLIFILLAVVSAQSQSSSSPVFKEKVLYYLPEIQKEYSLVSEISPQKQQTVTLNVEEEQTQEDSQINEQPVPQLKKQSQVFAIPIQNLENLNANRQQLKNLEQNSKTPEQKPAESSDKQKTKEVNKKQLMFEQIYHIPLKKDKIYTVPEIQERSVLGNEVKLTQQQKKELQNPQKQAQQRRIKQEQLAKIKAKEQQKIKLQQQQKNMQIQALKQKQLQILKLKQLQLQKQKQQVQKQKKQLEQLQERRKKQEQQRKEQFKMREEQQRVQRQRNRQEQRNRQAQNLIKEKIQVTDIDNVEESEQIYSQNEEFQRITKQQGRKQTDIPQKQQNIIKQPIVKQPVPKKPEQPIIQLKLKPKSNLKTEDSQPSSHMGKIFPIMVIITIAIFIYGYVSKKQEQKKRKAYNPTADDEQATFR